MQFRIIIGLCLLFIASSIQAQQKSNIKTDSERFFRLGAKAGVNINQITGQSYKSGFNYNYQLGAFMQFNFSNRFGIQPEVNFVQSSATFSNDATEIYDDLFRDGSQKHATLNRLEIPVLLNINVGESKHIKLQLGPSFQTVLKQTIDSLKVGGNIYKNTDWALMGGIWIQLPIINIGARYKLGLTNINAIDDRQTWKTQAIQIFAGITL